MKIFMKRFLYVSDHIEEVIVVLCMTGITIVTFFAVLARYVFGFALAGTNEISTMLFLWASFFGASAGFKYNKHGCVDLVVNLLPKRARRVFDLGILIVIAFFFGFLAWSSSILVRQTLRFGQVNPATGIPIWVVNLGVFIALGLCAFRCLNAVIRDLSHRQRYPEVPTFSE